METDFRFPVLRFHLLSLVALKGHMTMILLANTNHTLEDFDKTQDWHCLTTVYNVSMCHRVVPDSDQMSFFIFRLSMILFTFQDYV